jgi:hypothetical protein
MNWSRRPSEQGDATDALQIEDRGIRAPLPQAGRVRAREVRGHRRQRGAIGGDRTPGIQLLAIGIEHAPVLPGQRRLGGVDQLRECIGAGEADVPLEGQVEFDQARKAGDHPLQQRV